MSVSARKRSPSETGLTFSGSFEQFVDYYGGAAGGSGSFGGGLGAGVTPRRPPNPTPTPAPSPTISDPPIDDPIDTGDNDPSNFPPFFDPNEPTIPLPPGGSSEPPDEDLPETEDLPSVVVEAPRTVGSVSDALFPFAWQAGAPAPAPRKPARRPARRRKPAPPPRRRVRPVKPRIPITVPEIKVVGRRGLPVLGTILSLVPVYLGILSRVDRYGTQHMFDRMYGAPNARRDDDKNRSRRPDTDSAGDRAPVGAPGLDELPTVVVSGTRPSPFPAPAPLPGPSLWPGRDILPDAVTTPFRPPATRPRGRDRVRIRPSIDPLGKPNVLPQPTIEPQFDPVPRALPKPSPAPSPSPSPRPRPQPSPSPAPIGAPTIASPLPFPAGGTAPGQLPLERRCSCRIVDPNKRKPKKKPEKHETHEHAELEVEYKTKYGRVKVEGEAKKYCLKPPVGPRVCYTVGKEFFPTGPGSLTSILKKLARKTLRRRR